MKFDKILRAQERLDRTGIHATIGKEGGMFLHSLIKAKKPKNVLEVGTSIGYSAIWIASAFKGKLTCLDNWKDRSKIARKYFKKVKLNIDLIEGDALETIPTLKTKFDVVFLDATKCEYLMYLKKVKLNKNALIIADNTISHKAKLKDFLNFAKKHNAITHKIGKGITVFTL